MDEFCNVCGFVITKIKDNKTMAKYGIQVSLSQAANNIVRGFLHSRADAIIKLKYYVEAITDQ